MRGRGAVVGVGDVKPSRTTEGENTLSLMAKSGLAAIEDSGLDFSDIDGVLVHPMGGISMLTPSTVLEFMGMEANFAEVVDLGGSERRRNGVAGGGRYRGWHVPSVPLHHRVISPRSTAKAGNAIQWRYGRQTRIDGMEHSGPVAVR